MQHKLNQLEVERHARSLARRVFSGTRQVVRKKENHIVFMAESIRQRWMVSISKWQVKHLRWFLEVYLKGRANGTKYRYFRFIRKVLVFMGKWDDWKYNLQGRWVMPA